MKATSAAFEKFLRFLQFEKRYSGHTIVSYKTDLEQFFGYLKKTYSTENPKDITHFFVRSWIVNLIEAKVTARSVNRKISTLKSFFRFLLKEKIVKHNPMLKIISPKIPKRLPEFIQQDKLELLFNHTEFGNDYQGIRNRLILELLYGTGMRRAELAGLKDNAIDFSTASIKVTGKRNKERIIPLADSLTGLLKNYLVEKNNFLSACGMQNDFLLLDIHCNAIKAGTIYLVVKKYLSAVTTGKKKSPHLLRHSFATHMLNNGADINAIKELLGHASLAATQVYTHNTIEKLKKIYKQAHPKA